MIGEIIEVKNVSKDEIFNRARKWFSIYFVTRDFARESIESSGKDFKTTFIIESIKESVVEYEDKEAGIIIGKGELSFGKTGFFSADAFYTAFYSLMLNAKDNKMNIFYQIHKIGAIKAGTVKSAKISIKQEEDIKVFIQNQITDLKFAILSEEINKDW